MQEKDEDMKAIILALFVTIMSLFIRTSAWSSDPEWVGNWEFKECWPHLSGEVNNCIFYEMSIRKDLKDSGAYEVTINTNGYMAMQRVQARGISQGPNLPIKYVNAASDSFGPQYHQGARLLELKSNNGKITTTWEEFRPELDDNIKPGIYFQKVKRK